MIDYSFQLRLILYPLRCREIISLRGPVFYRSHGHNLVRPGHQSEVIMVMYLRFAVNAHVHHVGANDVRLSQSKITKNYVKEVCELASTISDTVICSGPLPAHRGDKIHSRLSSLNGWMSKWCPQNNIDFLDNWTSFSGRPDLLKRDGLHPSWGGATLLSRNMLHSLRVRT